MLFAGKIALVTGGSRGIGAAVCRDLARQGAHVLINYHANEAAAAEVLKSIEAAGGRAETVRASVGNADEVDAMFQALRSRHGRLDILVNNAGITRDGLLGMMSLKDWQDVMETNLTGVFLCCRAAVRMMMAQRAGAIVNMSSVSAAGAAGQSNYAATKAGIIALTRSLALEAAPYNVRVNCVAPGYIETDMFHQIPVLQRKKRLEGHPLRRAGKPEEVAAVVRFLASDDAAYVQGQSIVADGGLAPL